MRVLVVGGCGYLGSAVYNHLKESRQYELVTSLDLEWRGNPGIAVNVIADYREFTLYPTYDAILWFAGHSSVQRCLADPFGAFANNVDGIVRVIKQLGGQQKFIYASSSCVYDYLTHGRFHNMLDYSKYAAEEALKLLYSNAYILRLGSVAGASPNMRLDTMVNRMVSDAVTAGHLRVFNPGIERPILAMRDLLRLIPAVMVGEYGQGVIDAASFMTTPEGIAQVIAEETGSMIEIDTSRSPTYSFSMPCLPGAVFGSDVVKELIAHFKVAA